jgi:hypothetical protein
MSGQIRENYIIIDKINECLELIEEAIKLDPCHLDWYIGAKEKLEEADGLISFCVYD